jgi:hypothetical protein
VDTSDQNYRIREDDFQWFAINLQDTTSVTPPGWNYTGSAWSIMGDDSFDFTNSTGPATILPFISFGTTDSIAGATVDSAFLLVPYSYQNINNTYTDTVHVAAVTHATLLAGLQNETNNEANFQYWDVSETTRWPTYLTEINRTNIGEVTSWYTHDDMDTDGDDWRLDVTDLVQHLVDNGTHLLFGFGGYRDFATADPIRIYEPDNNATRSPALVLYLSE